MAIDRSKILDFARNRLDRSIESGNEAAAAANRSLISSFDDPQNRVQKEGSEATFGGRPSTDVTRSGGRSTDGTLGTAGAFVRDLPIPQFSQEQRDADFITGIGGKTLNQLTADEITRLIQLEQQRAGEGAIKSVTDQFGTGLQTLEGQIDRANLDLETAREQEAAFANEEIQRAFGLVDQKYAPRFSRLEQQGEQQLEDTQRSFSFRGTGRGTRATDARQEVLAQTAELKAAVEAEVLLEKRLQEATIRGEADAVIEGLSNQLNSLKTQRIELENAQATAIASLRQELQQTGAGSVEQFLQTLQTQASLAQFDPTLSNALGQIVDSQGNVLTAADGSKLEFATSLPDADAAISQALGFLADAKGSAIVDVEGNAIPINKGVKSTFQDGAKNTYILFEDGSVQQIGSKSAAGGSGVGGLGYDPNQTAAYNDIAAYAADNNVTFTQAVDDLGYGTSIGDRTELINETGAYVQALAAGQPAVAPEPQFERTGGAVSDIYQGIVTGEGVQSVKQAGGTVLDFLFGEKQQTN